MFLGFTVLLTSFTRCIHTSRTALFLMFRSYLSHFFNEIQQKVKFAFLTVFVLDCPLPKQTLWLVDCEYWQPGVCDHHNKLTVGSLIAALPSLQYHLSRMDLWRLTPVGLGDVHIASLKGWQNRVRGGVSAPIEAAQSSSHTEWRLVEYPHCFSCSPSLSFSLSHTHTHTQKQERSNATVMS